MGLRGRLRSMSSLLHIAFRFFLAEVPYSFDFIKPIPCKKNKTQWSIVTYAYNSGRHYVRMVGYVNTTLLLLGDSQQTQSHFFSTLVLFDYKVAQALQKLFKQIIRLNTLNNYIHKLFVQIFYLIENIICNYSS